MGYYLDVRDEGSTFCEDDEISLALNFGRGDHSNVVALQ